MVKISLGGWGIVSKSEKDSLGLKNLAMLDKALFRKWLW